MIALRRATQRLVSGGGSAGPAPFVVKFLPRFGRVSVTGNVP
jgi:hypothetical protein